MQDGEFKIFLRGPRYGRFSLDLLRAVKKSALEVGSGDVWNS